MITTEFQNLTYRQKEVCIAFVKSRGIKSLEYISKVLNIKPTTAKTHIDDIYKVLHINESQVQLMYYLLIKR